MIVVNSLKGVSKQIIEINYTRDDYVQKAILIINPDKNHLSKSVINQNAQNYMDSINVTPRKVVDKMEKRRYVGFFQAISYIAIGAAAAVIIITIFT